MKSEGKIIIVEGLQGSGKTLFCKSYVEWHENSVMLEEWVDPEILSNYINDMKNQATEFQFRAQDETLKNIKTKWILSYNYSKYIVDLYKDFNLITEDVVYLRYTSKRTHSDTFKELIVTNFKSFLLFFLLFFL